MFGLLLGVVCVAVAIGSLQSARGAAPQTPAHIGGVVPVIGKQVGDAGLPLVYHGGPVMTTNKTYAIYWVPNGYSIASGYDTKINQFFGDVAHDSNMGTNVYAVDTQYSSIQYSSSVGGSWTDTGSFPSSGCPTYEDVTECLTDAQIQAEVDHAISVNGWTRSGTNMFFVFTPALVGSCFDSSGSECAYTAYCAYHGTTNSGAIYANQPYAAHGGCDQGEYPNGSSNQADPTINVVSHEHNEAITDPQLNAWYDQGGSEIGDKCAWLFGPLQGPAGGEYNQTINGHHYFLQMEWSNTNPNLTCVQTYSIGGGGGGGGGIPKVTTFFPTAGFVGTSVTINGQHFTGTTTVSLGGKNETFTVTSDTKITAKIVSGTPRGLYPFKVTNTSGTGTSTGRFFVR
jgi:hypothetical protein